MAKHIGLTSYDPAFNSQDLNKPTIGATDAADIAAYMTMGVQEIYKESSGDKITDRRGFTLRAPRTITLGVTKYSTTISGGSGFDAATMIGCTVRIGDDPSYNSIISAGVLSQPHMGTTGTATALVYGDAIALSASVDFVIEPVEIPDRRTLVPAPDRQQFERMKNTNFDYLNFAYQSHMDLLRHWYSSAAVKVIATPVIWSASSAFNPDEPNLAAAITKYLKVYPIPDQDYPLTAMLAFKAPTFTVADLYTGTDYTTDPWAGAGKDIGIPENILVPFVLMHWMSHPAFKNESIKRQVETNYKSAKKAVHDTPLMVAFTGRFSRQ